MRGGGGGEGRWEKRGMGEEMGGEGESTGEWRREGRGMTTWKRTIWQKERRHSLSAFCSTST